MKLKELPENEPIEVIEVSKHLSYQALPDPYTGKYDEKFNTVEHRRVQMRIFTDGKIDKQTDVISQKVDKYYIGNKEYMLPVDTLKTKKVFFKDYSYIIVYTISSEFLTVGNVAGWFDVINDVSIYMQNLKDRKTLKEARDVIKAIEHVNNSNFSSLYEMLFSCNRGSQKYVQ